jgi:hypothetical protein
VGGGETGDEGDDMETSRILGDGSGEMEEELGGS